MSRRHYARDVPEPAAFGANSWLVEEMYERFCADADSVGESWKEFFSDYRPNGNSAAETSKATATVPATTTASPPSVPAPSATAAAPQQATQPAPSENGVASEPGSPIRGVAARIVENMENSLSVPTATSFRNVPAKLLEVNRKAINSYRERTGQAKVSFTHIIAYAIVRAIADAVPNMRNGFAEGSDGKPRLVTGASVNMGLAVDVDKGDGTRTLLVPVLRDADTLSFAGFLAAYDEIIRKVRNNKLTVDDFQGANITLTNPGTIGTVQSVPRLMPGPRRNRRSWQH